MNVQRHRIAEPIGCRMSGHGDALHQKGRLNNQGILRQSDLHAQHDYDLLHLTHDLHDYDEHDYVLIPNDFQWGDYPYNEARNYE